MYIASNFSRARHDNPGATALLFSKFRYHMRLNDTGLREAPEGAVEPTAADVSGPSHRTWRCLMSAHRLICVPLWSLIALCLLLFTPLRAQDALQSEIENSKFQFTGVVNANAVFVRSGPSENDYPTIKLDRGAEVTVVGLRFDWLKVVPPEGSFCYVAKAFVDRRGTGSVGRVTSTLNVRVGSQLNELKAKIATKLEPGTDVEIIGEEQEYYKIKPPGDVFFYVNKQFVEPVRPIGLAQHDGPAVRVPDPAALPADGPEVTVMPTEPEEPTMFADRGAFDQQQTPAEEVTPPTVIAQAEPLTPATRPADAEVEFDRLENAYADASLKPLDEQPVQDLLDGYQKLIAADTLPESLRRIAEFKLEVLKTRMEALDQLAETRKHMDGMRQQQMALQAERQELEQRVQDTQFEFYTAVGTLRPSSLQAGRETLYRLTDPSNGRTLVYLRTNDPKIAESIGQFVGVKGNVQTDPVLNLRILTPESWESVNPARVGHTVVAQIVPPSLLPVTTQVGQE